MNKNIALIAALMGLGLSPQLIQAQEITPAHDGTGTVVTPNGNRFDIGGGTLSGDGKNLFQSFSQFGLNASQIANFLSSPSIVNILSRVTGGNPSIINGLIQVTGGNSNLYLINPAGIIFGSGASLNVPADFTASTATRIGFNGGWFNAFGTNNYQALNGNPNSFVFGNSNPAAIINAGNLKVNPSQQLALMAGVVINTGTMEAPGGKITVAAVPGTSRLKISQEGQILSLEVNVPTDELGNPLPFTVGSVPALLTGSSVDTGLVVTPSSQVQLAATNTPIPTTPGNATVSGTLNTSNGNAAALGGEISVTGQQVSLLNASIKADGSNGGGTVLIGGDYQGQGTIPNAQNTYVDSQSVINANAGATGNGGKVIVWADQTTQFNGTINARGGQLAGDGGFAEVSGQQNLSFQGNVDLTATNGNLGTLLLDPENITIVDGNGGANDSQLPEITANNNTGATFTISETKLEQLPATANVVLEATNNITINDLADNQLTFQPGPGGSIRLTADADNNGNGSFSMNSNDTIQASARDISISGANLAVGNLDTSASAANGGAINLTATNGSITVNGSLLSKSDTSNGGAVNLSATGNISTGNIITYSDDNGVGGNVTLNAGGNIDTTTGVGYNVDLPQSLNDLKVPSIVSGSELGDGGNVNLTANGNIKTGFIVSGSYENGTGGNINLESKSGSINTNLTEQVQGEQVTVGALVSASRLGNGGNVSLKASKDITTGIIATGTIGPQQGGNVTLESTGGSVNTAAGANFKAPSVNLLTLLGVPQLAAEQAQGLTVGLGIFSFSNQGQGGNVTITAANDITTSNIVTGSLGKQGGNITLKSLNGAIDTSSGIFAQNLTQEFLTNLGVDANIASIAQAISQRRFGGLLSLSIFGNAGQISLQAKGDISTNYIVSSSFSGQGGDISIRSATGDITSGPVMLNQASFMSSPLSNPNGFVIPGINNQQLLDLLTLGGINSSGANGGDVTLEAPQGNVTVTSINAQGGANGTGGNVNIAAGEFVRLLDSFTDQTGIEASISTVGGAGGGSITVRHGGRGITPFVVGDPSVNGSAGALNSGQFQFVPAGSFPFTTSRGNVAIISVDFRNLVAIPQVFQPEQPPAITTATALTPTITINTLEQTREILAYIERETSEIPALIYVSFVPPGLINGSVTNEDFATKEANLTAQYQNALSLPQNKNTSVLGVIPEENYELELMLITREGKPYRIQLPGVTRKQVQAIAEEFYVEVSNQGSDYKTDAEQLYNWLLAPLEQELAARKIDSVLFFLPTGLRLIPLAALYDKNDPENKHFVIQKDYTVGLAPSLNLVDYRYRNLKNAPVLAFGASQFPAEQEQQPLPAVSVELPLIAGQIRSGEYFLNQQFTLNNLQRQRNQEPFPIVHLATHADFNPDNLNESYIQLYNQKLRLPQWQNMDLDAPTVDLLVISACKTAVGNPDIELGFAGLAVQAGVKTAIASLWYVGDTGTLALMDQFYRQLKTAPIKAVALRDAQRAMLSQEVRQEGNQLITPEGNITLPNNNNGEQSDLSHPYYWASFTLIGSPW
ncbi:CHAT domain-containing protein [Gloeothece verrucosa]|uniref:Filamentous hemagglutinin family outer membrane protein n=1 Tax=Gloeothece verrucosa (strain PCC 7822) TaxID=497965 RepID=E0UAQ4_GLOV7|nr:CHAT domain-containing protein [Gloeothece verrucosa]ADN13906.1 filamentous hemagglutinin family outer membrane protein [Gloeothece verrucosa PCC 7822]